MRVRLYRRQGEEFAGSGRLILQVDGDFLDLSSQLLADGQADSPAELACQGFFDPARLSDWLNRVDLAPTAAIGEAEALLPPLMPRDVGKVLCLGKNFAAHAAEFSEEVPAEPMFFNKAPECMVGNNVTVSPPGDYSGRLDHEAELAVVIGPKAHRVTLDKAMQHVCGYAIANDLSLRSLQGRDRKQGYPWFRSKNFDGACPIGPCFLPSGQLDPGQLDLRAEVNGELRQSANTRDMVISIPEAISYLSGHMTLNTGDIILMGTPAGVGPLANGDEVVCSIEQMGRLRTRIRRNGP
jgi:2-keto-4-pentenoate hydratase/2-oxohepta-3-ene-1,7-dioic acid hydratase in catechol pathway